MSFDALLCKVHDRINYNCAHFAADVWRLETGQEIGQYILHEQPTLSEWRQFKRVKPRRDYPRPLLVLMRSLNANKKITGDTHAGVYLRGKIWHLPDGGPQCVAPDLATIGFNDVRYYDYHNPL